jgi:hypothetical protein
MIQRLRNYLLREVLKDEPYYVEDDWCREEYLKFFGHVQKSFKRACCLTNENDQDNQDERIQYMVWDIFLTEQQRSSQISLETHIESLPMPNHIVERINNCIQNGKKYTVVYVEISWVAQNGSDNDIDRVLDGHATLMLFDLQDKIQWFFDPDDCIKRENILSFTRAFSRTAYLPEFEVVYHRDLLEEDRRDCIQKHFESLNQHHTGTCGIIVALVLVSCLRFDYWDTFRMSRFLKQISNNEEDKKSLIQKFVSWYNRVHENNYNADLISDSLQNVTSVGQSVCGVFSTTNHSFCRRRAKDNKQFCWQHEATMKNS